MPQYQVPPEREVAEEIEHRGLDVDALADEAIAFLGDPDVDDIALARMFIERGHSEAFAYWLVRESEVRRAPG